MLSGGLCSGEVRPRAVSMRIIPEVRLRGFWAFCDFWRSGEELLKKWGPESVLKEFSSSSYSTTGRGLPSPSRIFSSALSAPERALSSASPCGAVLDASASSTRSAPDSTMSRAQYGSTAMCCTAETPSASTAGSGECRESRSSATPPSSRICVNTPITESAASSSMADVSSARCASLLACLAAAERLISTMGSRSIASWRI
mmetsp:Transcript_4772/g.11967  ORF Transcript_4772/g.11967 Transcript_4772/m.11967 type:complete len:202 (-) Transcript_4772:147-752(-)